MKKLSENEEQEIRDSIKDNLELDFIENYNLWKRSLIGVNDIIRKEVKKNLIVTPFNENSLYTYDELCVASLSIVDDLSLKESLDPNLISKEITQQVIFNKLTYLLMEYIQLLN